MRARFSAATASVTCATKPPDVTKFPQIGRLEIEDHVEIGANTTIDRGALEVTRIGRGTKIDNLVHIGHNCQIGEDVVIAAQTGFSGSIVVEKTSFWGGRSESVSTPASAKA